MSFAADLKSTLSQKWLREKLTLKERAELLWEITTDLDLDTYEKEDEQGNYLGKDIDKAMEDLSKTDKEDERHHLMVANVLCMTSSRLKAQNFEERK